MRGEKTRLIRSGLERNLYEKLDEFLRKSRNRNPLIQNVKQQTSAEWKSGFHNQ